MNKVKINQPQFSIIQNYLKVAYREESDDELVVKPTPLIVFGWSLTKFLHDASLDSKACNKTQTS